MVSILRVGRATAGRVLFAGEHCSRAYQGYMEGACETAEQTVADLLRIYGQTTALLSQQQRLRHYERLRLSRQHESAR
ncbi:MAG: FAD-dependent oxidoreductase [Leptolyngbyaceae cyanobacterium]